MNDTDIAIQHITPGDGNIFEDLGFEPGEAATLQIKAQLMCQISEWVRANGLKQEEASKRLHVTRPRISDVMRGKTEKFTIDALVDMLEKTGKRVTVQVD